MSCQHLLAVAAGQQLTLAAWEHLARLLGSDLVVAVIIALNATTDT